MIKLSEEYARSLDQKDPLSYLRTKFSIKEENMIYMDGNSLGRLVLGTKADLEDCIENQWGDRLIRSWNEGWYTLSSLLGDRIAPIAGASAGEIIVSDSTSVNLYKLAYAALRKNSARKKIVTDDLNFPSDIYILQGLVKEFGSDYKLQIIKSKDGMTIDLEQVENAIDHDTALVSLSHVVFKSAFRYSMKEVSAIAKRKGALMLWDLSHSIGAVPGELNSSGADLAVGCTYKYLNGGPGAPAFLFVRKDLQEELESPIWGWFGQHKPFEFKLDYKPASGIQRFLAGTPPILSIQALQRSLDLFEEVGMDRIRTKSIGLSRFLMELVETKLTNYGFKLGSPKNDENRGSHITLKHTEAYRICKAMIDPSVGEWVVIPDFREPDNIRLGITPLYTSYIDIYFVVMLIQQIVKENLYLNIAEERDKVT